MLKQFWIILIIFFIAIIIRDDGTFTLIAQKEVHKSLEATPESLNNHTPENYCYDATENANWRTALKRFPNDSVLLRLYALRQGLCDMVDENIIPLDVAILLFEEERERWITEYRKENTTD